MIISSDNKKIVIVGDIHQDIPRLKKIIKNEVPDICVTTGDWFDSFIHDSDYEVREAANFLLDSYNNPKLLSCMGNHDVHYLWPNHNLRCSGFEERKKAIISKIIGPDLEVIRNSLHWFLWVDDYLISHAGVNYYHIPANVKINKHNINEWLEEEVKRNITALGLGDETWFTVAGLARGGHKIVGGLIWQDFDLEFISIDGISQIVGHTPHKCILAPKDFGGINVLDSDNLDVDCYLSEYLVITNGKVELKKFIDI